MTRYAVHPMEEDFQQWDARRKELRDKYWARLRSAWNEFNRTNPEGVLEDFYKFMEKRYGLKVSMTGGNIDSTYEVVNEAKHNLFLLKYQ